MSNLLKSASKIFLLLTGAAMCAAFLAVVLTNLDSDEVAMAVIAIFSSTISAVSTFYFTRRSGSSEGAN